MLRSAPTIAFVLCGLLSGILTGCAEGERSLGARLLPGWSDMDNHPAGPGVRPESARLDPDAAWPNLASVPPRPNVDWQTRFETLSSGLTQDLNDASLLRQSPSEQESGLAARQGDAYVPAPPVLSPIPNADVTKALPGIQASLTPVPKPPDVPVGRKQPPAPVAGLAAVGAAPSISGVAEILPPPPEVKMPDVNRIAPVLKQEPAAQGGGAPVRLFWQGNSLIADAGDRAGLEQLARLVVNHQKRVRVQLYTPDAGAVAADLAVARGAWVVGQLTKLGVPRRSIILANPAVATAAKNAAPVGAQKQPLPDSADITILP